MDYSSAFCALLWKVAPLTCTSRWEIRRSRIDGNLVDIESPLPTVEWVETILQNIIPEHLKEVLQSERD